MEADAGAFEGGEEERLLRFGAARFFTGQTLRSGGTQAEYYKTLSRRRRCNLRVDTSWRV